MLTDLMTIVPRMLRRATESEDAREQAVFVAWMLAVGGPVRRVTNPIRVERKTLIVAVPDATWRTQLLGMRGQALFKLNSILGTPLITAIEFVVNPSLIPTNLRTPSEVRFISPETQSQPLREQADLISDPAIRATFLRAAGKCLERTTK